MKRILKTIKNQRALIGLATVPLLIGALGVGELHAQTWDESNSFSLYNTPDSTLVSNQFKVNIRKSGATSAFQPGNVLISQLAGSYVESPHSSNQRYYSNLWGCSHSYLNFEMKSAVDIEVKLFDSADIDVNKTTIRPASKVKNVKVSADKKTLTFTMPSPCNIAVDINGVMAERAPDTNSLPAVHTLSIHGNPALSGKPTIGGTGVTTVIAGTAPTQATLDAFNIGAGPKTLYFGPGVHNIGEDFKVYPNRTYYIPGDAIVYGTFNNVSNPGVQQPLGKLHDASKITIFGHGTISGTNFDHWEMAPVQVDPSGNVVAGGGTYTVVDDDKKYTTPAYVEQQRLSYRKSAIELSESKGTRIEGIVIVNPANHSFRNTTATYNGIADQNEVAWVKIFAWRVNSDGSGINDGSIVHDCFYRVQDDGFYPKGIALRDCVLWSDSNGVPLRLSALHELKSRQMLDHLKTDHLRVEDMEVIFRRNMSWSHSPSIQLPSNEGPTPRDRRFVFSKINLLDQSTNRIAIDIQQPAGGTLSNVRFENLTVAKMPTVAGRTKNIFYADTGAAIRDINFHNLVIGGNLVTGSNWTNYFTTAKPNFNGAGVYVGDTASAGNVTSPTFSETLLNNDLGKPAWSADSSTGAAGAAIDGNIGTRWDTGTVQSSTQWFRLNMGETKLFERIILDCSNSVNDFPRSYEVYVSNAITAPDATTGNWGAAIATGSGNAAATVVDFTRQKAQHILIKQTGATSFNYWSIHEAYVFGSDALDPSTWSASASGTAAAASALDGKLGTRWTSNSFQAPAANQFFQVNMASQQTFERILLDSTESINDHPRGYVVKVSSDPNAIPAAGSWKTVATGIGFGSKTMITMLPQTAQHIRVEQTGTAAGNWWSIHEINVYPPTVNGTPPPSPWNVANIGGATGTMLGFDSSRWSTNIASGDIGGTSDSIGFAYKSKTSANCTISANIGGIDADPWFAKTGIMIRQSTQANAANVFFGFIKGGGLRIETRASGGNPTNPPVDVPNPAGRWLRLEKVGNVVTPFTSGTGAEGDWTAHTSVTLTLTGNYEAGLAASSQTSTKFSLTGIKNVSNDN